MNTAIDTAVKMLKVDEGWRSRPYYCSAKCPTIGYGFKLADKGDPLPNFTLSRAVGEVWLTTLVDGIYLELENYYDLAAIGDVRAAVLVSMAYQLGVSGLIAFRKTNALINKSSFTAASIEMLDSEWAKEDTPARAERYSRMMFTNSLHNYYGV